MDPAALKAFIRQISKEKDLEPIIIKQAIERAILTASRKTLSSYRDAVANLDMESGALTVSVTKTVVDNDTPTSRRHIRITEARKLLRNKKLKTDDEVIVPIDPSDFGRIAAQSARQMVMQQLRDAERLKIYTEFKDKVGQVFTGIVQRFEHRDVIMNIGKTEGVLPQSEQPMGAKYRFNDRLKVMIIKVDNTPRGPMIILSRKTPQLLIELFKQEVPEIVDGTVQIVGIAREAGVRTKLAVKSLNSDVDPVGACVGMKGSRVQMVVRELENEKIDIVPWSPDSRTFVTNALNPAKIVGITLDEEGKQASVVVAQGNLAIAIGRKGQNTKLAARLTGYRLDIRSENEDELAYEEIQRRYLADFLAQISGMPEMGVDALLRSNYNSVEKIANLDPTRLLAFTVDDEALAENLVAGAKKYLEALRKMEEERRKARDAEKAKGQEADKDTEIAALEMPQIQSDDSEKESKSDAADGDGEDGGDKESDKAASETETKDDAASTKEEAEGETKDKAASSKEEAEGETKDKAASSKEEAKGATKDKAASSKEEAKGAK